MPGSPVPSTCSRVASVAASAGGVPAERAARSAWVGAPTLPLAQVGQDDDRQAGRGHLAELGVHGRDGAREGRAQLSLFERGLRQHHRRGCHGARQRAVGLRAAKADGPHGCVAALARGLRPAKERLPLAHATVAVLQIAAFATQPRERLAHYCDRFGTVEINSTFYRWPGDAAFASWQRRLPEGFLLSVKAPRGLTRWIDEAPSETTGSQPACCDG